MKVQQFIWFKDQWQGQNPEDSSISPQLGLLFGNVNYFIKNELGREIHKTFPDMILAGCSTAGEITNDRILDQSLVLTLIEFEKTGVKAEAVHFKDVQQVLQAGRTLGKKLPKKGLSHAIVLSEGLDINGSDLVKGIADELPEGVQLTGGLAGDDDNFEQTYVLLNERSERDLLVLVGLYGVAVEIGHGCYGGWDPFGPDRLVTEAEQNILYKLDDQPALELYKKYLGEYADNLPSSGLLFPLLILDEDRKTGLVRTILGIDEEKNALIFAGDIPQGSYARLMKSNHYRLIDGAQQSAVESVEPLDNKNPDLALIFSCVGRKLVLKQRTEEELEVLREVYGVHQAGKPGLFRF